MNIFLLNWQIMDSLRKIGAQIERQIHPFCVQQGITALQLNVMMQLYFDDKPHTISELARRTCMAGANNSALCKKMEKDGYVIRSRAPDDERVVLVSLTEQGKQVVDAFREMCEKEERVQGLGYTKEDMDVIGEGLSRLSALLDIKEED